MSTHAGNEVGAAVSEVGINLFFVTAKLKNPAKNQPARENILE